MPQSAPATTGGPHARGAPPLAPDPARHLLALLDWLRRLMLWQVDVTRATYGDLADDEYRGLYVPRAEVDILGLGPQPLQEPLAAQRVDLERARAQADDLADALKAQGADLPLRPTSQPILAPPDGRKWELAWSSERPAYGGDGTSPWRTEHGWRLSGDSTILLTAYLEK